MNYVNKENKGKIQKLYHTQELFPGIHNLIQNYTKAGYEKRAPAGKWGTFKQTADKIVTNGIHCR